MSVEATPVAPAQDRPRRIKSATTGGDKVFRGILRAAGASALVIMLLIAVFLAVRSADGLKHAGWSFLTRREWVIANADFGIAAVLPSGIIIALVALLVAVPFSLATALFISEYAPESVRRFLITLIDLMAAIPSIVYGLWGLFFMQPRIIGITRWIANHLGFIPIFKVSIGDNPSAYTSSTLIAGVVVGLMIIPIITSLAREVYSQAPQGEREGAYALGSTRWGMIRSVVIPYGKGGVIGAVMLGFGRAMGETITVAMIISPIYTVAWHVLQSGGNSISALIAIKYADSSGLGLSALMAAGFVLFLITLIVNALAAVIIGRSRSGAQTG